MLDTILGEISACETEKDVRILLAVESGSRCWGFESENSDWDVRFVYLHPKNWYLRLEDTKDTIDWRIDDELDIVGWDLGKFLKLMRRSNPSCFEWLGSPIVYREESCFEMVREVSKRCFNPISSAYHYYGMGKKHDERYIRNGLQTPKHYLYTVRSILACKWSIERQEPVPMLFSELQETVLEPEMQEIVSELVVTKKNGLEKASCDPILELDEWILTSNESLKAKIGSLSATEQVPWQELDDIFIDMLG